MTIPETIYLGCGVASLIASAMLLRHYRRRRTAILFWTLLGFVGLAANNVLVFVDLAVFPEMDLSLLRSVVGAAGMLGLLYGLLSESTS